jgi:hypothetical protein
VTDPPAQIKLAEAEIRRLAGVLATGGPEADTAWDALRPLGATVVPYLAEAYPRAKGWRARTALLFHVIPHARASDAAFQLGLRALEDKSYMVRYRACMVLAYALNPAAIPALEQASAHPDSRTAEDARAALDAIQHQNHHFFVDRQHSGQSFWNVNPGDVRNDQPSG